MQNNSAHVTPMAMIRASALKDPESGATLADLVEGVAHELNNSIAVALGYVQLLKIKNSDEKIEEGLARIEKAMFKCGNLVKAIHEFNSNSPEKGEEIINGVDALTAAVEFDETSWKETANSKNLTLVLEITEESYPIEIRKKDLVTVISQLLHNAVDASPASGTITVGFFERGGLAGLTVSDSGKGIAEDIKARIYEPFFSTKKSKGSGLGLTVVQSIISRYGGRISFGSNEPSGTIFTVSFPEVEHGLAVKSKGEDKKAEPQKRILIVDDDDEIRKVLSEILTLEGLAQESCSDAYSAMEILEKGTFHMVITDLGMPGMSGYDLAEYIRDKFKKTEIVVLTGWGKSLERDGQKLKGIKAVLSKPFRLAQVLDLVRN